MVTKKFYDIHFHAMDLSHANITAFLTRFIDDSGNLLNAHVIKDLLKKELPRWKMLFLPFVRHSKLAELIFDGVQSFVKDKAFQEKTNNVRNLLSFMESSILYDFLILDYFLKNKEEIVSADNEFEIGANKFNKIVLCPLVMDFGYKNIRNEHIFYNTPPQKPITGQITDLLNSIKVYYNSDLQISKNSTGDTFKVVKTKVNKANKLFEIYPFMGLNTKNYSLAAITKMLDKYFVDFSKDDSTELRQERLYAQMGEFTGDLNDDENCKNLFAGIKVYPPLGFEPWPADPSEQAKVKLLYDRCIEKNIPIIAHCSTGGFKVTNEAQSYSDPGNQWAAVLLEYPALKIDFAHFGSGDEQWTQTIINHVLKEGSNVYTDFSCNTEDDKYYKKLNQQIKENDIKLSERILFGSDFMINLLWLKSYNEYVKYFKDTKHLDAETKLKLVNTNSEKFLFG